MTENLTASQVYAKTCNLVCHESLSRQQGHTKGNSACSGDQPKDSYVNQYTVETKAMSTKRTSSTTHETFGNRIFSCLVVAPAGRLLHKFETVLELPEVYRDAIKAYRSPCQSGKILHQDVSKDNIIITEAENEGYSKGRLIDLDVAKELEVDPNRPGEVIGTKPFIATGVLKGRPSLG